MDKQIIIDGVDVSGCECYSEHREGYCGWHIPCEGDICPYKLKWALQQLKRKEQECETQQKALELQKSFLDHSEWKLKRAENQIVDLNKMVEVKEQECKQLREIMHKDICSHYVLGECSQKHHNNCVGRNQCIKDLEQECEELRGELYVTEESLKDYEAHYNRQCEQLNQLKKENEKLEDKLRDYMDKYLHELAVGKIDIICKLTQTLTEIKKIAEHCMEQDICTFCDYNDKCYKGFEDEALSYDVCKLILQKISEVEDVENN